MLINRIPDRNSAEKVFMRVTNVEGATITTGLPVSLLPTAASINGINAVIANSTGDMPGFIGIATQDIANNDWGQIQIAGFVNSVLLSNVGTSITVNAGDPLVPSPAGFASAAPTYANSGFRWIIASNVPVAISAVGYASGIIRMI